MKTFIEAAKSKGYLMKGKFKPLPKRGSKAYNSIKRAMK
jgi:hypothetical protein